MVEPVASIINRNVVEVLNDEVCMKMKREMSESFVSEDGVDSLNFVCVGQSRPCSRPLR